MSFQKTYVYCASIILNHMKFMYDSIDSGNFVISEARIIGVIRLPNNI